MEAKRVAITLTFTGMIAFGVYHWFFVAPVVAVFFEGIIWALGAGFAMAWAFQRTMLDRGRRGVWWGLAFGTLFAATLIPNELAGLWFGPMPVESPGDILSAVPFAFLSVPLALAIGWALERRISWSFLVMVLSVHFMIGGSLTSFGGRGSTFVMFVMFAAMEIIAGLVMGWFTRHPPGHEARLTPASTPQSGETST